jgi:hypothetical protein
MDSNAPMLVPLLSLLCSVPDAEARRQISEPYDQFDVEEGDFGWRQLLARGCVDSALRLLDRYIEAHASSLSLEARSEIAFHTGQALLMSGRRSDAVAPLLKALAIGGTPEWITYVAAHLAFAEGNNDALKRARDSYALISPGSMRLKFVDGMLACPDKAYMDAMSCGR